MKTKTFFDSFSNDRFFLDLIERTRNSRSEVEFPKYDPESTSRFDLLLDQLHAGLTGFLRVNDPSAFSKKLLCFDKDSLTQLATACYLDAVLDPASATFVTNPSAPDIASELVRLTRRLLSELNYFIEMETYAANVGQSKDAPKQKATLYSISDSLTEWQAVTLVLALYKVVAISPASGGADDGAASVTGDLDVLSVYQHEGSRAGLYTNEDIDIRRIFMSVMPNFNENVYKTLLKSLQSRCPHVSACRHRDLIAVNNGILNYSNEPLDLSVNGVDFHFEPKSLHPFDPNLIFTSKCQIDYVNDATEPVLTNPDGTTWSITQWVNDLSDHEGVSDLIWEIIGAIIRPNVDWNKTAWFYSTRGNNGKGTLCTLMRNLCGPGSHTSIPLCDLSKDFALEPLTRVSAIIVDENDVGQFIDRAANLKAIVTSDVIQIDRKFKSPIAYRFHGFMVQCLNEFPRVKDRSMSFYRRQLFVPFDKSFTGRERKYIKSDYLGRKDVLEYVLWYVINKAGATTPGSYYDLSEPQATREVLAEYMRANDPVREFWDDFSDRFVWTLLPFTFLYDLYKSWHRKNSPSGSPLSRRQFISDLLAVVEDDPDWFCTDKKKTIRSAGRMDEPELLIVEYDLKDWMSPKYSGNNEKLIAKPILSSYYRGLEKV